MSDQLRSSAIDDGGNLILHLGESNYDESKHKRGKDGRFASKMRRTIRRGARKVKNFLSDVFDPNMERFAARTKAEAAAAAKKRSAQGVGFAPSDTTGAVTPKSKPSSSPKKKQPALTFATQRRALQKLQKDNPDILGNDDFTRNPYIKKRKKK